MGDLPLTKSLISTFSSIILHSNTTSNLDPAQLHTADIHHAITNSTDFPHSKNEKKNKSAFFVNCHIAILHNRLERLLYARGWAERRTPDDPNPPLAGRVPIVRLTTAAIILRRGQLEQWPSAIKVTARKLGKSRWWAAKVRRNYRANVAVEVVRVSPPGIAKALIFACWVLVFDWNCSWRLC